MSEQTDRGEATEGPVAAADEGAGTQVGGGYAGYVTAVLVIVYVFNFIDRQIVTILAEEIKADLGISDAQIGFLYGTAFAVFYAIFGIPLGKLADTWTRKNLIAIGLGFWSLMTALSGTARSFGALATYRIGVGIGEASASPAAFSMLSDYFPPRLRATVLSLYSSGIYIGAGIGIFIGGWVVDGWEAAYPDPTQAPLGLKGWQAAYLTVGIPGILMALWVYSLREPRRGQSEGLETPTHPHPFRATWQEFMAVLPPFTLLTLARAGGGPAVLRRNLIAAAAIALASWGLVVLTDDLAQWLALGVGTYAAFSWVQALGLRDPAIFAMMFKSRAFIYTIIGFPTISIVTYAFAAWTPPLFLRVHGISATEAGLVLGLSYAAAGWLGIMLGGVVSDRLKPRTGNARVYVALAAIVTTVPMAVALLVTDNLIAAYVLNFVLSITSSCWVGAAASTVNDLVLPRMRATASAFYILMATVGLAVGPYAVGEVSDVLNAAGMASGEALRTSLMISIAVLVLPTTFLLLLLRQLIPEEANRLERARAAGEPVETAGAA